jgi:glycosyltransferase involved in cell wall biosynthesis
VSVDRCYLDATYLQYGDDMRGIAQVVMQLCRMVASDARFAEVAFIATRKVRDRYLNPMRVPDCRIALVPAVPFLGRIERFHGAFSCWRYRNILKTARLIFHPEFRSVVAAPVRQAVLLYDFIALEPPPLGGKLKLTRRWFFRHKLLRAVQRDRDFVCISVYTRNRLLALFPAIPPARVVALHLGTRLKARTAHRALPMPGERLQLLYVGACEQRKNVIAMIRHLPVIAGGRPIHLHLAGRVQREHARALQAAVSTSTLSGSIELHDAVSDEKLAQLYSDAHFFLFPTLLEGFGLPIIEAMAHGLPVCAFNNSTIPEVAGNAAIVTEDDDFAGWGQAIARLASDPIAYKTASKRASEHAREFTEEMMFCRYGDYLTSLLRDVGTATDANRPE